MLNFNIIYNVNDELVFNLSEFIDSYFLGIPLIDKQGNSISNFVISDSISAAQLEIENYLSIKLKKQIIFEEKDYTKEDWLSWGYLRVTYPVNEIYELKGFVNSVQQMDLPREWLSIKRSNDNLKFRQIHVVPISSSSIQTSLIYNGVVPLGFFQNQNIPNYWKVVYTTGFDIVPIDLYNIVGKLASLNLFHILGDLILGSPGVVAKSISIDGLSQSYSTQSGFKNRIDSYLKDLELTLPRLYNYYKGITCLSL